MKNLKIINKDNQKGVCLDTYGNGLHIPKTPLQLVLVGLCLCSPGTNWLIPAIIKKVKGGWIRWN